ncbi:hypothetical protein IDJ75_20960 [Mucilaginibacter rigui]|uniref:Uncharacterized protein n=1 Tax=Mucilaginibacter rigui TaxID=534635 RepID=A0ABR7XB56_9SPHI|nr:hypothetical protein [Mucilaginibacter rigui]MBD1387766.1 hypothetical protein [Mucilaginibacter rigui]
MITIVPNMAYLDALREVHDMQKKHDAVTAHSTNACQQQLCNNKIDDQLSAGGIKK